MENLINYLLVQAKQHKALVENIPLLQGLSDLDNQTKELQKLKTGLQSDLEALRLAYKTQLDQTTAVKLNAASTSLMASQKASEVIKAAEAKAKDILSQADQEADVRVQESHLKALDWEDKALSKKVEHQKFSDLAASAKSTYDSWVNKIAELKAKL